VASGEKGRPTCLRFESFVQNSSFAFLSDHPLALQQHKFYPYPGCRFEELGLGAAILPEVLDNPELVELELAMAAMAAASARADAVFEPFPSFLLEGRENRGRAGWFNATPSPTSAKAAKKPVAANAQVTVRHSYHLEYSSFRPW
jgi:hypothetical protein